MSFSWSASWQMDTAPLGVMEAPGRTSSYQRATEAGGGGARTRSTVDPLLSPYALPSPPPPLGLQLGKWTDISGVVTGQWSDISMGVAKVKRIQCHPPPHPSKPSGNLFFMEFNICDEGWPEIHFQRWVSVIVEPQPAGHWPIPGRKKKKKSYFISIFLGSVWKMLHLK